MMVQTTQSIVSLQCPYFYDAGSALTGVKIAGVTGVCLSGIFGSMLNRKFLQCSKVLVRARQMGCLYVSTLVLIVLDLVVYSFLLHLSASELLVAESPALKCPSARHATSGSSLLFLLGEVLSLTLLVRTRQSLLACQLIVKFKPKDGVVNSSGGPARDTVVDTLHSSKWAIEVRPLR